MSTVSQEYLSIGGNRHTAASAWCPFHGWLAYGADQNVAIWQPLNPMQSGVYQILQGHGDKVTSIAFGQAGETTTLISGAADGSLIVWKLNVGSSHSIDCVKGDAHVGAVNTIATLEATDYLVTGGADALIKIWKLAEGNIHLCTSFRPKPRLIPLAIAVGLLPNLLPDDGCFFATAGTRNDIQVYAVANLSGNPSVKMACSLTGHEGWIRSLALRAIDHGAYLMASTSHDKYVRLWRFQSGTDAAQQNGHLSDQISSFEQTLTAKVKLVEVNDSKLSITFEALLLGHEDWVYSADWQDTDNPKLLTASADGTLAIWEPDPTSGIWVSETRLGEISGQKGATTATGSSGGFWTGRWIIDQTTTAVISLGRTGSWRIWHYDEDMNYWDLKHGIGGHTDSVNGLCWSPSGAYLLSTSSDQTTRLHAEWTRDGQKTWHEFSRCQIHGYNCNVVTSISEHQFTSGADEKLLRVFAEPKDLATALHRLCNIAPPEDQNLPETAAIPVLGLSNKEMGEPDDIIEAGPRRGDDEYAAANALADISIRNIVQPPTEDLLSRHTLWPEYEKLYGHGYEISEAAYSGDGILATACKASSIDHATIRLYDACNDWREIKPPLAAHSLTVTRLTWSRGAKRYLLSVGRDRQWTVFTGEQGSDTKLTIYQAMPKAHTRMILDATWSPVPEYAFFATAGRDKTIKFWGLDSTVQSSQEIPSDSIEEISASTQAPLTAVMPITNPEFKLRSSITRASAVTAIDMTSASDGDHVVLAVGEEGGAVSLHVLDLKTLKLKQSIDLDKKICPSKTVNRLVWRPSQKVTDQQDGAKRFCLAIAGADGSVRVLSIEEPAIDVNGVGSIEP